MASKVILMTLLPVIVLWVVAVAVRNALALKILSTQKNLGSLHESGCFDPTEALDGFI